MKYLRCCCFNIVSNCLHTTQSKGRATVEFVMKKGDGEKFDIEGELYDKAVLKMVVDGYNAPLTGGNFLDLVNKGFYNNMKIQRSDGFVVQTGDPEGPADGCVGLAENRANKILLHFYDCTMPCLTTLFNRLCL